MTGKLAFSVSAIISIAGAVVFFNSCGGGEEPADVQATEPVSIKIEEFTGGQLPRMANVPAAVANSRRSSPWICASR